MVAKAQASKGFGASSRIAPVLRFALQTCRIKRKKTPAQGGR